MYGCHLMVGPQPAKPPANLCIVKYYFALYTSGLAIAPFTGRHCLRKALHTAMKPTQLIPQSPTNPTHPSPTQHLQALAIPHPASGAPGATGLSVASTPGGMSPFSIYLANYLPADFEGVLKRTGISLWPLCRGKGASFGAECER